MSKRKDCDCEKCRALCSNEPGWFIPEEISVAADYLGMAEGDFIHTFLEEHIEKGIVVLSPKMDKSKGACVFFENGLCRIHPIKPYECRKVYGCEAGRRHKRIREIILRKWR